MNKNIEKLEKAKQNRELAYQLEQITKNLKVISPSEDRNVSYSSLSIQGQSVKERKSELGKVSITTYDKQSKFTFDFCQNRMFQEEIEVFVSACLAKAEQALNDADNEFNQIMG